MAVFPENIKLRGAITKTPMYRTNIIEYGQGVEQRISLWKAPRHRFTLNLDVQDTSGADLILGFFNDRKGRFNNFWFRNTEETTGDRAWQPNTAYVVGDIIRPEPQNGRSYICTVAGTTGGTPPAWPTVEKSTTIDGTVTWAENSYLCRFDVDEINMGYFLHGLYGLGRVELMEVSE